MLELAEGIVESASLDLHAVVPARGPLFHRLTSAGVATKIVPNLTWTDLAWLRQGNAPATEFVRYGFQRLRSVFRLISLLRQQNYDVVISNTNTIIAPAIAAKMTRVPHVWYVQEFGDKDHGLHYDIGFGRSMAAIGRLSCRVLVPSEAVRSHLREWVEDKKLSVLPSAVQGPYPLPAPEDDGTWRLVLVGRKAPGKGQAEALDAVALLRRAQHPVRLRLVGGGDPPYVESLRNRARELGIEEHVSFIGPTPHVDEHYGWAHVVLVCSQAEAFGRVTVEAMKYGRPIVGAGAAGTAELIRHSETGLLYHPGNAEDLASNVAKLMLDPRRAAQIARNAQRWAEQTFTLERYVNGFTALLQEAATSKRISKKVP